jgi:hypothetical protein
MTFKVGDIAVIVGSDYETDPDIGKSVELLELMGSVNGFADDEGPIWRVNRMIAQWDWHTEAREADLPLIGERWLMPLGEKQESSELVTANDGGAKP